MGYVFRDRYRAEVILDINHLQNCIKYIHENPVKAGIVQSAGEYIYSSFQNYLDNKIDSDILIETFGDVVDYMDKISGIYEDYNFIEIDNEYGEQEFENFEMVSKEYQDYDFKQEENVYKISELLKKRCKVTNEEIYKFMNLKRATYYNIIKKMKKLDF